MACQDQTQSGYPKAVVRMIFGGSDKKPSSAGTKEVATFCDISKTPQGDSVVSSGSKDTSHKQSNSIASQAWSGDFDDDSETSHQWPKALLTAVIVLMGITLLLSGCALGAPYWTIHGPSAEAFPFKTSEGLLMVCAYPYTRNITCGWLYYTNKPNLVITTAVLWLIGTFSLSAFAVMSCCLCTSTCRGIKLATMTAMGYFVPNLCFLIAVILWGVHSGQTYNQTAEHYHDWAFYLAIIVSIVSSILTAMLLKLMCTFRKLSTTVHSELF